ncbi:MAG TPA: hypothetical protein VD757_00705 [Candidatus Nitrosocosmicus sp.]|nr:hypothetical protein [Candidatus Nitrosocosmicus sp.]
MAVMFFYCSIAATWMLFFLCILKRPLTFRHIIIAIAGIGYSLLYETILGEYNDLYYYIDPEKSLLYIILSAVTIYPVIEIIYAIFLPDKALPALFYTALWIILMLAFEYASLYTGTLVLTGWKVIPWSIITYVVTYGWLNLLLRSLKKRGL